MNSLYLFIFRLKTKSFSLLFSTPCLNFFTACILYTFVDSGRGPLYRAIIEMVLQKKESTTFSSVKPSNGSSFDTFGGMVFGAVGFTFSTGRAVTNFSGSYGRFLSYIILCTSLSKSRCSGTIFLCISLYLLQQNTPQHSGRGGCIHK